MMMNPTKTNNTFLGYFILSVGFMLMGIGLGQNQTNEIKVGVVLDLQTNFSKICLTSINMSLSDFYKVHADYRTRLVLHVRDSMEDTVQASAAALDLIKNEEVSAIIGPRSSMQAEFMIRLANKSRVPTISFSATSHFLTSINNPYFVRATMNDSFQVRAIAAIVKYFGWRSVTSISVDNEYGEGMVPYLADALQEVQACVVYRTLIPHEANDDQILTKLYKLMTMHTRVFVLHMTPSLGFRVFEKAKKIGMMKEGYVWLLTDGMMNLIRPSSILDLENMQGVLGVRSHIPRSKALEDFSLRWKTKFDKENPLTDDDAALNIHALRAYDSITALAMAVEKSSIKNLRFDNTSLSSNGNTTDLGTLGVSCYGPSIVKALSDVRFKGLAGEFKLIDGQLESSAFDIINLVGNKERFVGFWTPSQGLVNAKLNKTTPFSREIIWPGDSTVAPKGWEIPRKLRVGVPVKSGFFDFVKVRKDPISNAEIPTGYSIDVFEAALKKLPHSVTPQYFGFKSSDQSYDEMVDQVYKGRWDAVVGDVTIRANRSLYVDFTLPYTESGVSMLVRMKDDKNINTWVFLKPWSLDLWITTACFFVFIGFIVWLFEHRVNNDFRGPPHHQIGTSFWFSFSTMVFAHREKVVSNLARFVVVVWCFVVIVLTQSYTANLTSILTVQRFRPEVKNVNDLIKHGECVGYQRGSFVYELLQKQGFHKSQLKSYGSAEKCDQLFSKGGFAAVFDEVAYLKVIISQFRSKYAMVEPSFKTAGFGFVFPKNSPLTGDVSRAILNLTDDSDEMQHIENKWFKTQSDCPAPNPDLSSNNLTLNNFRGLFLIAALASLLALLVFVANFLYEQRQTLYDDSQNTFSRKITSLCRIFDEKDKKSHMFKEGDVHNVSSPITHSIPSPSTVQITPLPPSPSQNEESDPRNQTETFPLRNQPEQDEHEESDTEFEGKP